MRNIEIRPTNDIVRLIAGIDAFKGEWRGLSLTGNLRQLDAMNYFDDGAAVGQNQNWGTVAFRF